MKIEKRKITCHQISKYDFKHDIDNVYQLRVST